MTHINNIRIKHYVHDLPENRALLGYARKNRRVGNIAEIAFWKQVHKKKFHGLDFDRQKVIGNYIVDFFVKKLALVIEIDGSSHNGKADYDAQRDKYLESLGLKVFHILLPRPTATPSKIEGELSRIGTMCRGRKKRADESLGIENDNTFARKDFFLKYI